jgi:hypothetical protein
MVLELALELAVPLVKMLFDPLLPLVMLLVELAEVAQALFDGAEAPALLNALTK